MTTKSPHTDSTSAQIDALNNINFREVYEEIKDTPYFQALLEEGYKENALRYVKELEAKKNRILIERMLRQGLHTGLIVTILQVSPESVEEVLNKIRQ